MNLDQLRVKAAEDLSGAEYKFVVEHQDELSADERTKFGLKAAAEEAKKEAPKVVKADEVTGDEGVVSIKASDLKAINDSIAELKASNEALTASTQASEREKMKAIVVKAAARGAIKADRVESYTDRLVAAQGEDREALIADLESLADNPLLAKAYGSAQTEGSAAMDVEAEILKKSNELIAAARAKGEKLTVFDARKQVLASDPDLEARSTQVVQAAASSFNPFEGAWGANASGLQGVNPEVVKR